MLDRQAVPHEAPETAHKAWFGAIGGLAAAAIAWATGSGVDLSSVRGALETLAAAGIGAIMGWITTYVAPRNRPKV